MGLELVGLILLLLAARVGGFLAKKAGMIPVIGEIIGGIIIGPGVLGLFHPLPVLNLFADIGVILLMFLIGLRLNIDVFEKFLRSGAVSAIFGSFIPFGIGLLFGSYVLGWTPLQSLFLGGILMATAVSITVRMLDDFNQTKTPIGLTILDAAVVENVIAVVLFTFLISFATNGTLTIQSFITKGILVLFFFSFVLLLGPKIGDKIIQLGRQFNLRVKEGALSLILIMVFSITYIADYIGLSIVIGAFLAGVILNEEHLQDIEHEIYSMAYGWFIPFFFAAIGTRVDPVVIWTNLPWIVGIFLVAVFTKLFGVTLGSKLFGVSSRDSLLIAIGMIPRGELSLILLGLGLSFGIFDTNLFSGLTVVVVLTMLVTPPIFRKVSGTK